MKSEMKSIGAFVCALAGMTLFSTAGLEDVKICNDQSLANAAAYTNWAFIRGTVKAVVIKIEDAASAVRTNAVALTTDDGQTLFSLNAVGTSTNLYTILAPTYGTTGSALLVGDAPAGATNILYAPIPVASRVKCIVTGVAFPTLTNSVTVTIIHEN